MTWTPMEKIESKEANLKLVDSILHFDTVTENEMDQKMLIDS